jgi:uncharacterized protein YbjT (DUF2867 family)
VLACPGHAGKVYELTGPEALTIRAMVAVLGKALGRRIRYVAVPPFLAALWMRRSGLPRTLVAGLMETLGALRRSEYAYVTEAVEQVTGARPRSFDAWCVENVEAFR